MGNRKRFDINKDIVSRFSSLNEIVREHLGIIGKNLSEKQRETILRQIKFIEEKMKKQIDIDINKKSIENKIELEIKNDPILSFIWKTIKNIEGANIYQVKMLYDYIQRKYKDRIMSILNKNIILKEYKAFRKEKIR